MQDWYKTSLQEILINTQSGRGPYQILKYSINFYGPLSLRKLNFT